MRRLVTIQSVHGGDIKNNKRIEGVANYDILMNPEYTMAF